MLIRMINIFFINIWNGHSSSQVLLTPTHLAIVMEYAAGGELFERICSAGRFSEDEVDEIMLWWWLFMIICAFVQEAIILS